MSSPDKCTLYEQGKYGHEVWVAHDETDVETKFAKVPRAKPRGSSIFAGSWLVFMTVCECTLINGTWITI